MVQQLAKACLVPFFLQLKNWSSASSGISCHHRERLSAHELWDEAAPALQVDRLLEEESLLFPGALLFTKLFIPSEEHCNRTTSAITFSWFFPTQVIYRTKKALSSNMNPVLIKHSTDQIRRQSNPFKQYLWKVIYLFG